MTHPDDDHATPSAGAVPHTGYPPVDQVLVGLDDDLAGRDLEEHPAILGRVHDSLRAALDPDRETA